MISVVSAVLIGAVTFLLYIWNNRTYNYWKRRGVKQEESIPIFGNTFKVFTFQKSLTDFYQDIYEKHRDEKIVGFYETVNPCLLVRDPRIIENIMVKNFSHFVNRDDNNMNKMNEVDHGMQHMKDSEWRGFRYKVVPCFSSGKLKMMFQYMKTCSQLLIDDLDKCHDDVDIKDISTQYALDVIATSFFGINIKGDVNKSSEFRSMGKKIFTLDTLGYFCFLLLNFNFWLASKFGITLTSGTTGQYFGRIIKDTMKYREVNNIKRNDFIDLLLQLKNKVTIEVQAKDPDDLKLDYKPVPETFTMTESVVISQAYTFLASGFNGLSSPMTLLLYELAKNQTLQDKVREDVNQVIAKYGDLNYDSLKNCKYLDCCIKEGLRLYPMVKWVPRSCTKDYEILPGVKLTKGTKLVVSLGGLHMDPEYFSDPHVFNPDRFTGEITSNINEFCYLPFGAGPRMCIGKRFSQLTMKMALANILSRYRIFLSSKTPTKLSLRVKTFFVTQSEDPILFNIRRI